eukprot:TRINITY_DN9532_c0_g1_i1.p1 TRINITY_DN9532_c0_g1~~TRINITY_DN9532_c0_g1_i1.p1  ORF type:complete len:318 (+),score=24.71 TRINITY_DN9532_c0_g1_i1:51-1004(+)
MSIAAKLFRSCIQIFLFSSVLLLSAALLFVYRFPNLSVKRLDARFYARPHLVGHNGGGDGFPEDTIFAVKMASQKFNCSVVEVDVQLSKDDQLVVIHDGWVNRTTNGTGRVSSMTVEELQRLDAAYQFPEYKGKGINIPTLEEVIHWLQLENTNGELLLIIEPKLGATSKWVEKLLKAFSDHPELYARTIVISFEPHILYQLRKADQEIATGVVTMSDIASKGCTEGFFPWWFCEYFPLEMIDRLILYLSTEYIPQLVGSAGMIIRDGSVPTDVLQRWIEERKWWVDVFDVRSHAQADALMKIGASVAPKDLIIMNE